MRPREENACQSSSILAVVRNASPTAKSEAQFNSSGPIPQQPRSLATWACHVPPSIGGRGISPPNSDVRSYCKLTLTRWCPKLRPFLPRLEKFNHAR